MVTLQIFHAPTDIATIGFEAEGANRICLSDHLNRRFVHAAVPKLLSDERLTSATMPVNLLKSLKIKIFFFSVNHCIAGSNIALVKEYHTTSKQ